VRCVVYLVYLGSDSKIIRFGLGTESSTRISFDSSFVSVIFAALRLALRRFSIVTFFYSPSCDMIQNGDSLVTIRGLLRISTESISSRFKTARVSLRVFRSREFRIGRTHAFRRKYEIYREFKDCWADTNENMNG